MPWFRIPRFVLAFLVVMAAAIPTMSGAQEATPAAPQPPTQPTSGPGSSEALFGGVSTIEQKSPDQFLADYWLFVPADPLPETPRAGEPFPLVIVLHGSGAINADPYLAWIEHLVRRGAVVLYPMYKLGAPGGDTALQQTLPELHLRRALETLEQEGVVVDLTRVAVVGHSLGADQALIYTATAAGAGLPVPAAVMSIVPSCHSFDGACLDVDLSTIPATTRILLVTEADDQPATAAVELIWAELGGVPVDNRNVVQLVTDTHAWPPLRAMHLQALAGHDVGYLPDAFDWYGTWKWLDGLMGCAFEGEWCDHALGNTPEQRFMGTWSDGVPVTEAVVTDDPA